MYYMYTVYTLLLFCSRIPPSSVTKEQHSRWCGKTSTAEMAPKAHLLLRTRGLLRDAGIGVGIYAHPGSLVGP